MPRRRAARRTFAPHRRGLTIPEVLVSLAACVLLGAVFLAAHEPQRRMASLHESFNNLLEMGAAYASYAHENQDRIATFTWPAGVPTPSSFPELRGPYANDISAAAGQLADILRRRGIPETSNFPPITIVPHFRYSHMVLADFLGHQGVWWPAISPEDVNLRRWASDPAAFLRGESQPQPAGSVGLGGARWIFSTSYLVTYAAFSPDSGIQTCGPAGSYGLTTVPGAGTNSFGRRTLSEVAFPAQKVHRFDEAQRHFGSRVALFAYPEARVPVLTFDGATSIRVSRDNDRGFDPRSPTNPNPVLVSYTPEAWQPPVLDGVTTVNPGMQWTRDGLRGRDFDR